jgi:hypothetical protein
MLSLPIRLQRLKAIAGRDSQLAQHSCLIQKTQFSQRDILDIRRQLSAPASGPDQFRFGIGKALDQARL